MTVLVTEPVLLELNKIRSGHNSATNAALTPIAHRTAIYNICDAVFVCMCVSELLKSFFHLKCFVAKKLSLSEEVNQLTHCSIKFTFDNVFILVDPFARDQALDNLVFQNMAWRPEFFLHLTEANSSSRSDSVFGTSSTRSA